MHGAGMEAANRLPRFHNLPMRLKTLITTCGLLLALPSPGIASAEPARIVVFGDSTSAPRKGLIEYGVLLERELNEHRGIPVRVINAGVGGNTTKAALARFHRDVLDQQPVLVVIQFGINDSTVDVWKKPPATTPRVPLTHYRDNLLRFIIELHEKKIGVILMTPNPLGWTEGLKAKYGRAPYRPEDAGGFNVTLSTYAAAVRQIAAETSVPIIDVERAHREFAETSDSPLLLDGMHPNQTGHDLVARLLADAIVRHRLVPAAPNSTKP